VNAAAVERKPTPPPHRRLVLASKSPRRRQLLNERGFDHHVVSSGFDDGPLAPGRVSPRQWVAALAHLKAKAGLETLHTHHTHHEHDTAHAHLPPTRLLVLAADTVVVKGDALIGQPRDADDAARIIATLQDGSHHVVTGVALMTTDTVAWLVDQAHVTVGHIGRERIQRYIDSGDWRGKAGAYNLAERIDDDWPITFQGDPTTIMGLPMRRLEPALRNMLAPPEPSSTPTSTPTSTPAPSPADAEANS